MDKEKQMLKPGQRLTMREIDEIATAVTPAYYVKIHSNAPNFNKDLEYPLDTEFSLTDGRLCPGLIVSMQCALTRSSDYFPSRPFMCEFSEEARLARIILGEGEGFLSGLRDHAG